MTKPGNSGSDEPKDTPDTEPTTDDATEPTADAEPEQEKKAEEPVEKPARARKPVIDEPVMPTAREAAARRQATRRFETPPPRTLRISFYFFVASGLVWLISMIASIILKQDIIDAQVKLNKDPNLTPEQIANGVTQILWVVLVASLTFTVFLGLFGYKATEGTRRARTLVTIFATVLVLFHLLLNGTPAGILSAMFALFGLGLLWSPSARAYFPPRELR